MMRIEDCRWVLYCSGQFRCNGAWNRAAGETQYSAPLLRQNILTQTLPWKKGGYALIYFSVQVQLQFYFRRENNSQFGANPFHTLEHIHNCLCSCIHHFIPVQQTITYFAKKNKTKVLVHPFYSFSLNLVSQASTSSQDIHAFNFTDPPFSFETTLCSFSKNIDQY